MVKNQNQQFKIGNENVTLDKMKDELAEVGLLCECCYFEDECSGGITGGPNGPIYPPCCDNDDCFDVDEIVEEYKAMKENNKENEKMTAREMFEKEDFEFAENNNMIIYQKKYMNLVVVEIKFEKYLKAVFVSGLRHAVMLDCECLKAIEKQYKELGWVK